MEIMRPNGNKNPKQTAIIISTIIYGRNIVVVILHDYVLDLSVGKVRGLDGCHTPLPIPTHRSEEALHARERVQLSCKRTGVVVIWDKVKVGT